MGNVIPYVYVLVLVLLGLFLVYDYLKTRQRRRRSQTGEEVVSTATLTQRVQSLRIPPHSIKVPGLPRRSTYISLTVSGIESISIFVPLLVGFGIGFFAGLLGAGGGFILMPVLIFVVGIPTTVAIGTDLFQVIITGSWGTLLYALSNNVDPLMALIILAAASAGSQIGTTATKFVDPGAHPHPLRGNRVERGGGYRHGAVGQCGGGTGLPGPNRRLRAAGGFGPDVRVHRGFDGGGGAAAATAGGGDAVKGRNFLRPPLRSAFDGRVIVP